MNATSSPATATGIELPDILPMDTATADFQRILMTNNQKRGDLWLAWHYLQVYSTWGLRLPVSEAMLKLRLNITNPGDYSFFPVMLESYQGVFQASNYFKQEVFPAMVSMGRSLNNFAQDASNQSGAIFSSIIDLVDAGDTHSALELLADLQQQATDNSAKAGEVGKMLGTYSAQLTTAEAALTNTRKVIDASNQVNDARITELQGGDDVTGSIANFTKLMEINHQEYDHDVIVASTTPTYAWVFPFGTIAAAIIAGVYGDKAVKALEAYEKMKAKVAAATQELTIALSTQGIQNLASKGVKNVLEQTELAISHTVTVQNAWASVAGNLDLVKNKLLSMTDNSDETTKLKSQVVIKLYAKQAADKWDELMPAIKELTDNPYIIVESEDVDSATLLATLRAQVNTQAAQN